MAPSLEEILRKIGCDNTGTCFTFGVFPGPIVFLLTLSLACLCCAESAFLGRESMPRFLNRVNMDTML